MAKAKQQTEKCGGCGGRGVVAGRYTEPAEVACPDCGGSGERPADKADVEEAAAEVEAGPPVGEAKETDG